MKYLKTFEASNHIVDKDLFLNDFKNARSRSKEEIYQHLVENFGIVNKDNKDIFSIEIK